MITLRGLTKRYGKTLAVDDLDLRIHPGRSPASWDPTAPAKPPPCGWCWAWTDPQQDRP